MNKEERYDLIERYVRQELTESETRDMEALLSTDKALRLELALHREVHHALHNADRAAFEAQLKEADHDYFSGMQSVSEPTLWRRYLAAAAAVALLLTAAIALYVRNGKPDAGELFVAYYETYEMPGQLRSDDSSASTHTHLEQAMACYEKREFTRSADYFSLALNEHPNNMTALFLRGVSYLETDKAEFAIRDFQNVIAGGDNLFMSQSRWYLALSYLKQDKINEARQVLNAMPADNQRAAELLRRLP